MNKAEEFAWKLYPNTEPDLYAYPNELAGVMDYNLEMSLKRRAVIEGYTQAVKDMELTGEDVKRLFEFNMTSIADSNDWYAHLNEQYEETAKKFNEWRRTKNDK